jgi:hypothetical protein
VAAPSAQRAERLVSHALLGSPLNLVAAAVGRFEVDARFRRVPPGRDRTDGQPHRAPMGRNDDPTGRWHDHGKTLNPPQSPENGRIPTHQKPSGSYATIECSLQSRISRRGRKSRDFLGFGTSEKGRPRGDGPAIVKPRSGGSTDEPWQRSRRCGGLRHELATRRFSHCNDRAMATTRRLPES